jgi:LuxR family transcriptional regulator, maltose regulon positive regulatory protein
VLALETEAYHGIVAPEYKLIRTARLAKLTRPAPTSAYARERLFDLLDQQRSTPAVWLAGPPGSGKTTLVAEYTARRGLSCLWYQIDRGDADVASSFFYLAEAAREGGSAVVLPHYQPEYLGNVPTFARTFFRELFRQLTPVIVFDNYQDSNVDSALHDLVLMAMNEVPDDGRIFVLSHNDPPPRFAGLRGRGRLAVVGWNELRLSLEECRGIVEARGLQLAEGELERLHARTQGWVAGLVLLLQGLRSRAAPAGGQLGGTPSVIFDYVAEEIFEKFELPVRELLLRAAYLPQITMAMAEQLGIGGDARAMLRELTRSEFLVTIVQAEPQLIVQFHPLLREFLVARAEESGGSAEIEARRRVAAKVLADHGLWEAAAALFTHLCAWEELAALVVARAHTLLEQGRGQTLQSWILALPAERRARDPWLQYWLGAACFPYAPREARQLFADAYARFAGSEPMDVQGAMAALNSALEAIMYDPNDFKLLDPWIDNGARWAAHLQECQSPGLEARLTSNMFMALALRQPQHADLPFWRDRAQQLSQTQRDPNVLISIYALLATLSAWVGQFARGEPMLDIMREIARSPDVSPVSATKFAQCESMFYMLAGDAERCMAAVRRGLDIVARSGVRLWNETLLINGVCGALAEADLETAKSYLQQLEARPLADRKFDVFLHAFGAAWYASLRGDVFLAHQQLKLAVRTATELGLPFFQVISGIALAQVLFDSGDERGAQLELARTLDIAGSIRNRLLDFTTLMWRASLGFSRGNDAEALEMLRSGLAIGRERGLMHFLWWQPQRVALLCQRALEADLEPDYVRRLIQKRHLMPERPPYQLAGWPWRLRIHAFGSFRFSNGADAATRPGKRAGRPIELLKALVAYGGEHVKPERLADALWPHADSDYAMRSLNTTLHRLRRLLGEEAAIEVRSGELALNRQLFWLDTWAFDQASETALDLAAECSAGAPRAALLAASNQALGYYRGPLLADEREFAWALAPRERCRAQLLRLLTTSCQALEKNGGANDALDLYRQGVDCDPLAEALNRRLVLALHQAGRSADAADSYHRYRALLKAELKCEPSAAMQELLRSLPASPSVPALIAGGK